MKKTISPELKAKQEAEKALKRAATGFKRTMITECETKGMNAVMYQIEHLVAHPNQPLPKPLLNHEQTINVMRDAVAEYKHRLRTGHYSE